MFNPETGHVLTNKAEAEQFTRWFNQTYNGTLTPDVLLERGIPTEEYVPFKDAMEQKYGGFLGEATAFTTNLLRTTTFGASDLALSAIGGEKAREWVNNSRLYNPYVGFAGDAAGFVAGAAPGLVAKGVGALGRFAGPAVGTAAKALTAPLAAVNRAGQVTERAILGSAVAKGAAQPTVLRKMLAAGGNAAVQGAFFGAGNAVSELSMAEQDLLQNPDETAEKVLSQIGLSSLYSAGATVALGGALGALAKLYNAPTLNSTKAGVKRTMSGYTKDARQMLKNNPEQFNRFLRSDDPAQEMARAAEEVAQEIGDTINSRVFTLYNQRQKALEKLPRMGPAKHSVETFAQDMRKFVERSTGKIKAGTEDLEVFDQQAQDLVNRMRGVAFSELGVPSALKAVTRSITKLTQARPEVAVATLPSLRKTLSVIDDLQAQINAGTAPKGAPKKLATLTRGVLNIFPQTKTLAQVRQSVDQLDELLSIQSTMLANQTLDDRLLKYLTNSDLPISPRLANDMARQAQQSAKWSDLKAINQTSTLGDLYRQQQILMNRYLDEVGVGLKEAKELREANKKISNIIDARKNLKTFGFDTREIPDVIKMSRLVTQNDTRFELTKQKLKNLDNATGLTGENALAFRVEALRAAQEIFGPQGASAWVTGRAVLPLVSGGAVGGVLQSVVGGAATREATALAGQAINTPIVRTQIMRAVYGALRGQEKLVEYLKRNNISPNAEFAESIIPFLAAKYVGAGELATLNDYADSRLSRSGSYVLGEDNEFEVNANPLDSVAIEKPRVSKTGDLDEAFNRRVNEIQRLVKQPILIEQLLNENLADIRTVVPSVAEAMESKATTTLQNLANRIPGVPITDELSGETYQLASDSEKAAFGRYLKAVDDPFSVLRSLRAGVATKEEIDALKDNYPALYAQIVYRVREAADKKGVTYKDRLKLRALIGDNAVGGPSVGVLQRNFATQNEPTSLPNVELSQNKLTDAQRIEAR